MSPIYTYAAPLTRLDAALARHMRTLKPALSSNRRGDKMLSYVVSASDNGDGRIRYELRPVTAPASELAH